MAASVCAGKSIFIVLTPRIQNCSVCVRVCVSAFGGVHVVHIFI